MLIYTGVLYSLSDLRGIYCFFLRKIAFSVSTAKNTNDETAPTNKNSFNVNASVLKTGCRKGT